MKRIKWLAICMVMMLLLPSCQAKGPKSADGALPDTVSTDRIETNAVIDVISTRRSIRHYKPQPVGRDTMRQILQCGIMAPNGMNKQSWELRVIDNPELLRAMTDDLLKVNPQMAERPGFQNIFNNAPTVVFIAHDPAYGLSQIDCGLLGGNLVIAAWSMGIGSCCMGMQLPFLRSPEGKKWLDMLKFSPGYELLYTIGFGYPDEQPEARPRDEGKIQFIDK